jgi:hypothetical protein
MLLPSCKLFALIVVLTAGLVSVVQAQSEWETLRPEGEEFTVQMPKGSTLESSKDPYHKMEINSRIYLSRAQNGPVFAVVSLSGIKSNPAMYTEMQRVNSYVDAFKTLFPPKISPKTSKIATPVKLAFVAENTLQGHPGREYKMSVGTLSGTAQVFATKRRFYALVYLNSKKDDEAQEQFVSSFALPERFDQEATVAAETNPTASAGAQRSNKVQTDDAGGTEANGVTADGRPETAAAAAGDKTPRKPIPGGLLNSKAIVLPKPDYPIDARNAGVTGAVAVQVTVDESGMVIDAKAISGPQILHPPSVNAALQARFNPTSLMGEPVKVSGVLVFNFAKAAATP